MQRDVNRLGKEGQDSSKGLIVEFFAILYEEVFAYQTVKLVKTSDMRLTIMKSSFVILFSLYIIIELLAYHSYFLKETPYTHMGWTVYRNQSELIRSSMRSRAWSDFCEADAQSKGYLCKNVFAPADQWSSFDNGNGFLTTCMETSTHVRTCGEQVDSECVNKLVYKTPLTYFTNGEAMKLELSAMYSASWGASSARFTTVFTNNAGREVRFSPGERVVWAVGDLLEFAGLDLDATMEVDGALYRMREWGALVVLEAKLSNFQNFNFFRYPDMNQIKVTLKASGAQPVWNVPPPIYINHTMVSIVNEHNDTMALDARTVVIVRKGYGVRLINVVTGEVGKFQYSMLASSLGTSVALLVLATLLTDIIASLVIPGFRRKKKDFESDVSTRANLRGRLTIPKRSEWGSLRKQEMKENMEFDFGFHLIAGMKKKILKRRARYNAKQKRKKLDRLKYKKSLKKAGSVAATEDGQDPEPLAASAVKVDPNLPTEQEQLEFSQKQSQVRAKCTLPSRQDVREWVNATNLVTIEDLKVVTSDGADPQHHSQLLWAKGKLRGSSCCTFSWAINHDPEGDPDHFEDVGVHTPYLWSTAEDCGAQLRVTCAIVDSNAYAVMEATATTVTLQTDPRLESYVAQLFHTNKQKRVIFELDPDPALEQVDKYLVFNKARQLMACPYAPTAEEAVPEGSAALNLRVTRGDVGLDRAHEHIFQICGRLFRAKSRAQRDAVVLLLYGCLENAYSMGVYARPEGQRLWRLAKLISEPGPQSQALASHLPDITNAEVWDELEDELERWSVCSSVASSVLSVESLAYSDEDLNSADEEDGFCQHAVVQRVRGQDMASIRPNQLSRLASTPSSMPRGGTLSSVMSNPLTLGNSNAGVLNRTVALDKHSTARNGLGSPVGILDTVSRMTKSVKKVAGR